MMKTSVFLSAIGFFLSCACSALPGCRRTTEERQPRVLLEDVRGHFVSVRVEVVRRPEEKAQGLMFRRQLDPDAGMLFVYSTEDIHPFWMKNTYLPLDMIFIDANHRIAGVVEKAEPLTETNRSVDAPSLYVLEVNGGFVKQNAIPLGAAVRFEAIESIAP
jgi:uncharacterized protein